MKKLLTFLFVFGMFLVGIGQTPVSFLTSGGLAYDTLTNGDTVYLTRDVDIKAQRSFGIIAYADTLSGTDAVITVIPQVSLDPDLYGWADYETAKTLVDTTAAGAVAYAERYVEFHGDRLYFPYWRLMFIQTGTATTLVKGWQYLKQN